MHANATQAVNEAFASGTISRHVTNPASERFVAPLRDGRAPRHATRPLFKSTRRNDMRFERPPLLRAAPVVAAALLAMTGSAFASSHREAPFITTSPKVDASDFY